MANVIDPNTVLGRLPTGKRSDIVSRLEDAANRFVVDKVNGIPMETMDSIVLFHQGPPPYPDPLLITDEVISKYRTSMRRYLGAVEKVQYNVRLLDLVANKARVEQLVFDDLVELYNSSLGNMGFGHEENDVGRAVPRHMWEGEPPDLYIITDPISILGLRFGQFAVGLNPMGYRPDVSYPFVACPLNPLWALDSPKVGGAYISHPHVRNGFLCLGERLSAVEAALRELRFHDAFTSARMTLQSYNPPGAFLKIDYWFEGFPKRYCNTCRRVVEDYEAVECSTCGYLSCPECLTGKECREGMLLLQ
jgi:hypothetical protein